MVSLARLSRAPFYKVFLADIVAPTESLFYFNDAPGQTKRQAPDFACTSFETCGDPSFRAPRFEELNTTQEQRDYCNNDSSCIYDLVLTGDMEVAELTLETSENDTRLQTIISSFLAIL